ncbi:hypothetical protein BamIOP4010DRAFT_1110 [Burkholderia ambifaria IOP40-10]|uniref:Uncharacterized protein n=1 Tax=Burkholderia ambifaria IOP40-10 TaxID=396596 RepID=B1FAQ1_9BURK|nr:hypothetical protein BamIOP4010DRAFT_1110 [Burkholderia ambifaria IOP40-10]
MQPFVHTVARMMLLPPKTAASNICVPEQPQIEEMKPAPCKQDHPYSRKFDAYLDGKVT